MTAGVDGSGDGRGDGPLPAARGRRSNVPAGGAADVGRARGGQDRGRCREALDGHGDRRRVCGRACAVRTRPRGRCGRCRARRRPRPLVLHLVRRTGSSPGIRARPVTLGGVALDGQVDPSGVGRAGRRQSDQNARAGQWRDLMAEWGEGQVGRLAGGQAIRERRGRRHHGRPADRPLDGGQRPPGVVWACRGRRHPRPAAGGCRSIRRGRPAAKRPAHALLLAQSLIELGDLLDEPLPERVLEVEDRRPATSGSGRPRTRPPRTGGRSRTSRFPQAATRHVDREVVVAGRAGRPRPGWCPPG